MLDVCCGIGSDTLALAERSTNVIGYDLDPVRILMAQLNAEALGSKARFEVADVTNIPLIAMHIFYDPGRRDELGNRIFDVEKYRPPLSLTNRFECRWWLAKLSPGVDTAQLAPYRGNSYLHFVSVNGELKEALLGHDNTGGPFPTYSENAILFHEGNFSVWKRNDEADSVISEPRQWLIEPDPALI